MLVLLKGVRLVGELIVVREGVFLLLRERALLLELLLLVGVWALPLEMLLLLHEWRRCLLKRVRVLLLWRHLRVGVRTRKGAEGREPSLDWLLLPVY